MEWLPVSVRPRPWTAWRFNFNFTRQAEFAGVKWVPPRIHGGCGLRDSSSSSPLFITSLKAWELTFDLDLSMFELSTSLAEEGDEVFSGRVGSVGPS